MSEQTQKVIPVQKDETHNRALRIKVSENAYYTILQPKSAAKSTRITATLLENNRALAYQVQQPFEPPRKNPHRRTPGKTDFTDFNKISPQKLHNDSNNWKASLFNFDQSKSLFYSASFSNKKNSTQKTPLSAKKPMIKQENKRLNQAEVRNQFYQRQMQSYYEKKAGIVKAQETSAVYPVMDYMKDQPKHDLSPATYSPKKEVVLYHYPEWTIGEKNEQVATKDQNPGPGSYDPNKQFGSEAVAVKIRVPSSPERENSTPGPGAYENQINNTKPRAPAWELADRPQPKTDSDSPGPGHYEQLDQFGQNSIKYSIRGSLEQPIPVVPGPGFYQTQDAENQTKPTIRQVQILPEHSKPALSSEYQTYTEIGPGSYSPEKLFGADAKTVSIQGKRETLPNYSVGPGQYNPESADGLIKQTSPSYTHGIRRSQPTEEPQTGPGSYDYSKIFGQDAKSFKISETRQLQSGITVGPGEYNFERADNLTKPSTRVVEILPYTKQMLEITNTLGPGQYNYDDKFGQNLNNITIGVRREENTYDYLLGPGRYSPEQADFQIYPHAREVNFSQKSRRFFTEQEMAIGPGSYNPEPQFGDDAKDMTIGLARKINYDNKIPGPGYYNPGKADSLILANSNISMVDFNGPNRFQNLQQQNLGPGSYNTVNNFGDNILGGQIFERRDEVIKVTPGPGQYSPEKSNEIIFQKAVEVDFSKQQARKNEQQESLLGPGSYEQRKNFGENLNEFHIGVRRDEVVDQIPGPGQYSPEKANNLVYVSVAAVDFSKATERINNKEVNILGPGQYDNKDQFGVNMNQITFGIRREQEVLPVPGPGHYHPENADNQVKLKSAVLDFSKQSERTDLIQGNQTGPGSYQTRDNFGQNLNNFTIGTKRESFIEQTPGPGAYSPEKADCITKQSQVSVDFSKNVERQDAIETKYPGPGSYNCQKDFGDDLNNFAIGIRRENVVIQSPGPGSYNPELADQQIFTRASEYSFKEQTGRKEYISESLIGPGTYQNQQEFGNLPHNITIGVRRENNIHQTVGPGAYQIEKADSQVYFRHSEVNFSNQSPRKDKISTDVNIGPGHYNHYSEFEQFKKITIGVRRDQQIQNSPGPADYCPERSVKITKTQEPIVQFSKSPSRLEFKVADSQLGPGQYEIDKQFGQDLGKITIQEKRESIQQKGLGPGEYQVERCDTKIKPNSRVVDFSNQTGRVNKISEVNPGPGTYNQLSSFEKLPAMTIQEKRYSFTAQSPGPGAYSPEKADAITKVREITPDFSKSTSRKCLLADASQPGPGHYNTEKSFVESTHKITIGMRKEEKINSSLGPGTYSPEKSDGVIFKSSRKVNFLSSPTRKTKNDESQIGPGSYKHASSFDQIPTITISERREDKILISPGPGEYDVQKADAITKNNAVAVNFSASQFRNQPNIDPNNGPGTYDPKLSFGQQLNKMTIGQRKKQQIASTAGPGSYNVEKANQIVKQSAAKTDFSKSSPRKSQLASADLGPGSYNPLYSATRQRTPVAIIPKSPSRFKQQVSAPGSQVLGDLPEFLKEQKPFTIGVRRGESIQRTLGPGEYEANYNLVRARSSSALISKSPPRFAGTERASQNVSFGEGDFQKVTDSCKGFTIGVRRPDPKQDDFPGPGFYDPTIAEKLTKASSPSRSISKQSSISANRNSANLFKRKKSVGFLKDNLNLSYHTLNGSKSAAKLNKSVINDSKSNGLIQASKHNKPSSAISQVGTKVLLQKSSQKGNYSISKSISPSKKESVAQQRKSKEQDKVLNQSPNRLDIKKLDLQKKHINVYQK